MFDTMDGWMLVPIAGILGWVIVMAMLTLSGKTRLSDSGKLTAALTPTRPPTSGWPTSWRPSNVASLPWRRHLPTSARNRPKPPPTIH
jgi:hypothetical protein